MALRNAVLNTAVGTNFDENLQMMFLDFLDGLTPLHLHVLKYFDDPQRWITANRIAVGNYAMGSRSIILELSLPELNGKRPMSILVVDDLSRRGLLKSDSQFLNVTVSDRAMFDPMISDLGKQFLLFITAPVQ